MDIELADWPRSVIVQYARPKRGSQVLELHADYRLFGFLPNLAYQYRRHVPDRKLSHPECQESRYMSWPSFDRRGSCTNTQELHVGAKHHHVT